MVEIMIVVAIVALLATLAVPSFMNARIRSQRAACVDHLRQISGGVNQYALTHNGQEPTSVADMVPDIFNRAFECPSGGSYIFNPGADPECPNAATMGHTL